MERETGGPAFPVDVDGRNYYPGMLLRDYFAAKALQGAINNVNFADTGSETEIKWVARMAYEYADAMLAARAISKATGE